jgi:uncharacterized membrane protein
LLNLWRAGTGSSEYATRFLSVIPALLSVLVTIKLGVRLGNSSIGLLSGLLLTVSPFFVLFSRMARYYALSTFLTGLSLWLFLKILRHNEKRFWLGYIIVTTLLIYTNYLTVSIILAQNVVIFGRIQKYRPLLKRWIISQGLIFGAYLPWLLVLSDQLLFLNQNRWSFEWPDMVRRGILNLIYLAYAFSIGETISPWRFFITLPLFAVIVIALWLGLGSLARAKEKLLLILVTLVLPTLTLLGIWSTIYSGISFVHFPARLLFIVPFIYIILAMGLYRLLSAPRPGSRVWPKILVALLFVGWGFGLRNYYQQTDFINANYIIPWRQIISDLQDTITAQEVVVVLDEPSFKYYQAQFRMVFLEGDSRNPLSDTLAELLVLNPDKIWLVARDRSEVSMALTNQFESWLAQNYALVSQRGYLEEDQLGLFYKEKVLNRALTTYKITVYEYQRQ